jgi:tetratricopeptide (TPR) repeat protein
MHDARRPRLNEAVAHLARGEMLAGMGLDPVPLYTTGFEILRTLILEEPDEPLGHLGAGFACLLRGNWERRHDPTLALPFHNEALRAFETASRLAPHLRLPRNAMANTIAMKAAVKSALGRDPKPDLERAAAAFDALLEADTENTLDFAGFGGIFHTADRPDILASRAAVFMQLGSRSHLERAVADLDAAIDARPAVVEPYVTRAAALLALAPLSEDAGPLHERAALSLREALRREPGHPRAKAMLAHLKRR